MDRLLRAAPARRAGWWPRPRPDPMSVRADECVVRVVQSAARARAEHVFAAAPRAALRVIHDTGSYRIEVLSTTSVRVIVDNQPALMVSKLDRLDHRPNPSNGDSHRSTSGPWSFCSRIRGQRTRRPRSFSRLVHRQPMSGCLLIALSASAPRESIAPSRHPDGLARDYIPKDGSDGLWPGAHARRTKPTKVKDRTMAKQTTPPKQPVSPKPAPDSGRRPK